MKPEIKYPPKIQQKTYAKTLEEQQRQLENDDLIRQSLWPRDSDSPLIRTDLSTTTLIRRAI